MKDVFRRAQYPQAASQPGSGRLNQWERIEAGVFDAGGGFSLTNTFTSDVPNRFYRVLLGP
jgi:hypothetical protein